MYHLILSKAWLQSKQISKQRIIPGKKKKDYFETSERIKLPREDTNFKHVWTEQKNFKIHDAKTNCKEKLINP